MECAVDLHVPPPDGRRVEAVGRVLSPDAVRRPATGQSLSCRRVGADAEPQLGRGLKAGAARRRVGRPRDGAEARIGNAEAGPGAAAEKEAAVSISGFPRAFEA